MGNKLLDLMNTVRAIDIFATLSLLLFICGMIFKYRNALKGILESWRKQRNFEDDIMTSLRSMKQRYDELDDAIRFLEDSMYQAKQTSKEIQNQMYQTINDVSDDVKMVLASIDEMQKKEELSRRANIKAKIEQIYRECADSKCCTDTQFETLKDLIEDYERHGGHNSFVHSLVEKEMYTWDIIEHITRQK